MQKVRLGIIGIGNMGTEHCQNIVNGKCPEIELTAVADIRPERLEWAANELPETVARFDNAEVLMDSGLVDAVLIAVPHYDHPPIAIEAFNRGLHVFTEKPAGVHTAQVRAMNEAADRAGTVFGIMWNWRTNNLLRKMKELVDSGKYGEIRRTNWMVTVWYRSQAYYNSGSWRATWVGEGGGVLMNQCPHQLDIWQWICGLPKTVTSKVLYGKWHDIEVDDDATVVVEYENGATGVFVTSTGDAHGTNRFEILLDKAKLVVEKNQLTITEFAQPIDEFTYSAPTWGKVEATTTVVEGEAMEDTHATILNAFAAAILRGEPLYADGREGLNEVTLANAIYLSDWLGKPVTLPLDEKAYQRELKKRVKHSRLRTAETTESAPPANNRSRWRVQW